jgi:putative hydrolase of the HAD superfamily
MRYTAVIFDLGGTLVRSLKRADYAEDARRIASLLDAPADDFVRLWFDQADGLMTGAFPSYEAFIKHICSQLALNIQDSIVIHAASVPFENARQMIMFPRQDAIDILTKLKSTGYKTALISDCGPDVPQLWGETPFAKLMDVAIFSCAVGMNKADPRIFRLATTELGVQPNACVYVADGMRQELANAASLGMRAVQIVVPREIDSNNPLREEWNGTVISSLRAVLDIVG